MLNIILTGRHHEGQFRYFERNAAANLLFLSSFEYDDIIGNGSIVMVLNLSRVYDYHVNDSHQLHVFILLIGRRRRNAAAFHVCVVSRRKIRKR
jgi:hypothetical protein